MNSTAFDNRLLQLLTPQRLWSIAPVWRYALAAIIVMVATALRRTLIAWLGVAVPYDIALVAAVVTTVLLGSGPGLVSVMLGGLGVELFVTESVPTMLGGATLARFGMFVALGLLVTGLFHVVRVAQVNAWKTQARLEALSAATFEGVAESEGGRIVNCNEQFARMAGRPVAELKGRTIEELIAPEDRERALTNIRANRESVVEHGLIRADGTRLIVEAHGRPLLPQGTRRQTVIRDITERKRAEKALQRSEAERKVAEALATERQRANAYNRSLIEASLDPLVTIGPEGKITDANMAAEIVTGCARAALIGTDFSEYFTEPEKARAGYEQVFREGLVRDYPLELRHRDGRVASVLYNASVFRDESGKVMGVFAAARDISARKRAEEALKEANERLEQRVAERTAELRESERQNREFIDAANSIIIRWGNDGKVRFINDFGLRFFGYARDELVGEDVMKIVPRVEMGTGRDLGALVKDILVHPEAHTLVPNENIRRDGTTVHVVWSNKAILDDEGNIKEILSIGNDVTPQKRAEAAAQAQRLLLQLVVNHLPAAVCVIRGSDLRIQLLNPAYQAIAPGKAMLGKTLDELWPETQRSFAAICRQVLATGEPHNAIDEAFTISRSTGGPPELAYFSWSLFRVRLPGDEGWAILNTAWETTSRKRTEDALQQSEERFRTLADSIPNLAWWADGDGYVTWYNRRWYEYTGTAPEQMEGWGWQSVHDPEMLPKVLERWKTSIATGEPFEMEIPLRGSDGRFRWFLTRVMPLRDASAKVLRWFGTSTDVSDAREAREVLARGKEELERLVAERTAKLQELVGDLEHFSYTLTHDMRAPLRAMRSFADVMAEECANCPELGRKAYLQRIAAAAERMDGLITDALSFTKAVRQELPLEVVDAAALLRGMLDSYPELQPSKAHITVEGEIPAVMANEAGLTQCFSNLLGNAVKFVSPGQTPRVRIWAETRQTEVLPDKPSSDCDGFLQVPITTPIHRSSQAVLVRIWFEDNGLGIPSTALGRVFDMFTRMHKEFQGTGIGLALVRKVVQRMGGRVGVESEVGKGSKFWLELRGFDHRMARTR